MQGNQDRPAIRVVLREDVSKELSFLAVRGDRPSVPVELDRRRPGQSEIVTPRKEADLEAENVMEAEEKFTASVTAEQLLHLLKFAAEEISKHSIPEHPNSL
jgi:hypothetical protein